MVASRAAYSRVTGLDPAQRLVVRNAGGVAAASIQVRDGAWYPILEGNATVVYRAEVDLAASQAGPIEYAADENAAYATLDERNTAASKNAESNRAPLATDPAGLEPNVSPRWRTMRIRTTWPISFAP